MCDIELNALNYKTIAETVLQGVETISRNNRKKSEKYLYCGGGYDTESTTILKDDKSPDFAFVYHVQIMINGTYIYFRDLWLLTPFLKALQKAIHGHDSKKGKPHLIIWVANLDHEYAFFKRELNAVGVTDSFAKSKRAPLKICCENIEFRECIGLFGTSLADIAKKHTKTQKLKGDLDYTLIRHTTTPIDPEKEYHYMKNDVQILDELSYIAFEKFTKKGYKLPYTKTGILRQECKRAIKFIDFEYNKNKLLMPDDENDYVTMRRYMYKGGVSGSNILYVGHTMTNVECADITSDYPAQLNHELYPAGQLIECEPKQYNNPDLKNKFRIYDITCTMYAKTRHAVYSKDKIMNEKDTVGLIVNNGKIVYCENCRIMVNNTEMSALIEIYDFKNIVINRMWYFTEKTRCPKFLRDTMNEHYKNKQHLKATGQSKTKEYKEEKETVNSFYGMCVTRLYTQHLEIVNGEFKEVSEKPYTELKDKMWLNPYIGYWCTTYARNILIRIIAKFPDLIIQYDTDSVYYITENTRTEKGKQLVPKQRVDKLREYIRSYNDSMYRINNAMFEHDEHFADLGAWECEKPFKRFKCLGAKRYLYETYEPDKNGYILHPVIAGLPKESFVEYVENNVEKAFSVFDNDMTIDSLTAHKLASEYYDGQDGEIVRKVTDYTGKTEIITVWTYHALYAVDFTLKMVHDYMQLRDYMQGLKAYPEKYRKIMECDTYEYGYETL